MSFEQSNEKLLVGSLDHFGILRLVLSDVERRNALSETMLNALIEEIEKASDDENVRVIIFSAAGPVFVLDMT